MHERVDIGGGQVSVSESLGYGIEPMQPRIFGADPDMMIIHLAKLADAFSLDRIATGYWVIFLKEAVRLDIIVDPAEKSAQPHATLTVLVNGMYGVVRDGKAVAIDMAQVFVLPGLRVVDVETALRSYPELTVIRPGNPPHI